MFRKNKELLKSTRNKVFVSDEVSNELNMVKNIYSRSFFEEKISILNNKIHKIFKNKNLSLQKCEFTYYPIAQFKVKYHKEKSSKILNSYCFFDLHMGEIIYKFIPKKHSSRFPLFLNLTPIQRKILFNIYKEGNAYSDSLFESLDLSPQEYEKNIDELLKKDIIFDMEKKDGIYFRVFEKNLKIPKKVNFDFKKSLIFEKVSINKFDNKDLIKLVKFNIEEVKKILEVIYEESDFTIEESEIIYVPLWEIEVKTLLKKKKIEFYEIGDRDISSLRFLL